MSSAVFLAREAGVVAGFEAAQTVFAEVIPMFFLTIDYCVCGFSWILTDPFQVKRVAV
jgi:hypothetical protein